VEVSNRTVLPIRYQPQQVCRSRLHAQLQYYLFLATVFRTGTQITSKMLIVLYFGIAHAGFLARLAPLCYALIVTMTSHQVLCYRGGAFPDRSGGLLRARAAGRSEQ
jgi:hypothetical protein